MPFIKTETGRRALLERAAGIGVLERRILILSDGRRGRELLVALLGAQTAPTLDRLLLAGLLIETAADHAPALTVVALPTAPVSIPASGATSAAASPRRSLPASRMYLVDMLRLRRDPESSALATRILASRDDAELITHMRAALTHIDRMASGSYAARVRERLAEVMPESLLPALSAEPGTAHPDPLESAA